MEKIKAIYSESYFSRIVFLIFTRFFPALKRAAADSFAFRLWLWFDRVVLNSAPVKLFFDPEYIADIWYSSYFYNASTRLVRKASAYIPKASIRFDSVYIGIFLVVLLLVPKGLWSDMFWIPLFSALALFYISRNIRNRTGVVFVIVNIILLLFLVLLELALPYSSVISIVYMLLGIDLFFLISFSLRCEEDLKNVTVLLLAAASALCCIGFMQNKIFGGAASASFADGVTLGEILVLVFPFTFIYPLQFERNPRKSLYAAFIFIAFFNAITATRSKAAFIGFLVELAILIFTDLRYIPFLLLLIPFGLGSLAENFGRTIYSAATHGNIINNVINLFMRVWNYGFGVNSERIMDIYGAAGLRAVPEGSMIKLPYVNISPIYLNVVIDIGAVVMFGFLAYMLRLAHSALTLLFVGDRKYRRYFAAGLATLIAVSVSSFFETTIFESRTMLVYWAMLVILRAVRIMSFGISDVKSLTNE